MQRLEELRRRIGSAESLHSVARAMKALSAVRIRTSRETAEGAGEYERTLELAFRVALRARPSGLELPAAEAGERPGVVVFGSDLGLAGPFNARIAARAADDFADGDPAGGPARVAAVGGRVEAQLAAAGVRVDERVEMPGSSEKLEDLAQDLLILLEGWRGGYAVEDVRVYHNAYRTGGDYAPVKRSLLPLDPEWLSGLRDEPWPSRVIPMFRAPWNELFAFLVREYLFLSLFRAGAESMAAEHASRMQAMEKAIGRIEEHLGELRRRHRTLRQAAVTEELLDVSAGYEVLTASERPDGDGGDGAVEGAG